MKKRLKKKKKPPPEGPEVRVMADWLQRHLLLPTNLVSISVLSGRYQKKGLPYVNPDTVIKTVNTCGKFLWLECQTTTDLFYFAFTFGMSGSFSGTPIKHSRVQFNTTPVFFFNDIRNFGTLKILHQPELNQKLARLGLDPLTTVLTFELLQAKLNERVTTLAEFLMDQRNIAGVGNYLKAEILWRAKLSPWRLTSNLSTGQVVDLLCALNLVPVLSYHNRGATIQTYYTPDQQRGAFADLFKVYKRKIDSHGNPVQKETTKDKRTTYWAPAHQI